MIVVESAGITDVGRKRAENQDALLCDDDLQLYVVADGLGGHQAGAVASSLVIETITASMMQFRQVKSLDTLEGYDHNVSLEANKLLASIFKANRRVNQVASQEAAYHRMGSTVSAACFVNNNLIAANVGDSPMWLVHNRGIETLSVLHTVAAERAGLSPGDRSNLGAGFGHVLTRAMGIESSVRADICEVPCFVGDVLVMSSDGLSNKVSPAEILDFVSCERPDEACRQLVALANSRGGDDNITVIVARVAALRPKGSSILARFRQWLSKRLPT
jgi:PPM family protein phosphatase